MFENSEHDIGVNMTIDHAAEARKHLADAVTDPQATPWDLTDEHEQWHIDATLSVAQVHAALALVEVQEAAAEQARIANWIAYLTQQDKIPAAHREWIEAALSEEEA